MTDANPESEQKVTEGVARTAYLGQTPPRSISRLQKELQARFTKVPGMRTLYLWSSTHGWPRKAAEFDERTTQKAVAIVEKQTVLDKVHFTRRLREVADRFLTDAEANTAETDAAQLARTAAELIGKADVLEGGVSDRTSVVNDDPAAEARAAGASIRALISKARGSSSNANGAANGHAKAVNGHAGNGHGEPPEH